MPALWQPQLGRPVVPFDQLFLGSIPLLEWTTEKKGTLILTFLLEDLANQSDCHHFLAT